MGIDQYFIWVCIGFWEFFSLWLNFTRKWVNENEINIWWSILLLCCENDINREISGGWKSIHFWIIRKLVNWTHYFTENLVNALNSKEEKKKTKNAGPPILSSQNTVQIVSHKTPIIVIKCTLLDVNKVHHCSSSTVRRLLLICWWFPWEVRQMTVGTPAWV